MRLPRKCEVCGHEWKSKYGYIWILVCPKCRISGYHEPLTGEQKVIDSVRNGEPVGEPLKAVFPETSAPAPDRDWKAAYDALWKDRDEAEKRLSGFVAHWKAEAERLRKLVNTLEEQDSRNGIRICELEAELRRSRGRER